MFNGCSVLLGDLEAGEVKAAHLHIIKFVEFLGHGALHQRGDVVPFGSDGHQLVLREHRLESLQQGRLNDARINLAIGAGNGAVNASGFVRADGVLNGRGGLNHLKVFRQRGEFLGPHLCADIEGRDRLDKGDLEIQARQT